MQIRPGGPETASVLFDEMDGGGIIALSKGLL